MAVTVEIWSDVVCPWCAIGAQRLEAALERLEETRRAEIEVRWRSFELDPHAPADRLDGRSYETMLAAKYRTSIDQAHAMVDRMVAAGAEAGIEFRFDIARPGNTFDAHRLLHHAHGVGLQGELKSRFLRAYHSEGEAIGEHDTLTRLAVETGLDADAVRETLAGDVFAEDVRADEAQAREYGIGGVPFFVLDGRLGISGAQPAETLVLGLEKVFAARADTPTAEATAAGTSHEHDDTCGPDGCAA